MINGIDVSRYQGKPDWAKVAAAGYRFAIIRATVGDYYTDPEFEANWDGAKANGIVPAAYHVSRPDIAVENQMARLRGAVDGNSPTSIWIDCEVTPEGLPQSEVERGTYWLLRRAREHFEPRGCLVGIYSAQWWWNPNIGLEQWVKDEGFLLWPAYYGANTGQLPSADIPTKYMPVGWDHWDGWQYTSRGAVPGISGFVDLDLMKDELFQRIGGTTGGAPPPPPVPDLEARLRAAEARLDAVDAALVNQSGRLDGAEARLATLEAVLAGIRAVLANG